MRLKLAALVPTLFAVAGAAQAHPGHGAAQPWHWHATDTAGFITVAVLAGVALWLSRDE